MTPLFYVLFCLFYHYLLITFHPYNNVIPMI